MEKVITLIYDIVWSPALIVVLVGAGLYFSIKTRFVQIRRLGLMNRLMFFKYSEKEKEGFSAFNALCVAVSGRVGIGNIVGVSTAIALGGAGSVFWMWVIAFLGAATAFTESTLAQIFKFHHNNEYRGGPSSYIEHGLKQKWLGILFAILTILSYGALIVFIQSFNVAAAFNNSFNIPVWISGSVLALAVCFVIVGGMKRISDIATALAPIMAIGYLFVALIVIVLNFDKVPGVFSMIFSGAFGIHPLTGGMVGSAITMGVKRGLFSNEAGQGGGAIISAGAICEKPAQQGLIQALSVYIDTILVCTATALMILCTDSYNVFDQQNGEVIYCGQAELGDNYVLYAQNAFDTVFPGFGDAFVAIALLIFVFTSLLAYYYYSESSLIYLFSKTDKPLICSNKTKIYIFRFCFTAMIVIGAFISSDLAWMLGDIGIGLTTWINIIALVFLFPLAGKALKEFEEK